MFELHLIEVDKIAFPEIVKELEVSDGAFLAFPYYRLIIDDKTKEFLQENSAIQFTLIKTATIQIEDETFEDLLITDDIDRIYFTFKNELEKKPKILMKKITKIYTIKCENVSEFTFELWKCTTDGIEVYIDFDSDLILAIEQDLQHVLSIVQPTSISEQRAVVDVLENGSIDLEKYYIKKLSHKKKKKY